MLILGWHGNPRLEESEDNPTFSYHDAAAVILRDGEVVAAIEEERLNRVKHTSAFPSRAIRFCLDTASARIEDVDAIVTDIAEEFGDFLVSRDAMLDPRQPFCGIRQVVANAFQREFAVDVSAKLRFCKHHEAHLQSAWYPSAFRNALVLCLDGDGDGASGLVAYCSEQGTRILRHLPESLSLGNFYMQQLFFLGYERFDEYKAMGLAPYGDPGKFTPILEQLYELQPEGRYSVASPLDRMQAMREAGLTNRARRKGELFKQEHRDYAAALQIALERIVDHIVTHFQRVTGATALCISGGVGHNCTLNGRLARSGRFEKIYIQPSAHDAGNALGAAVWVARKESEPPSRSTLLPHLFLGTPAGQSQDIGTTLRAWQPLIDIRRVEDPAVAGARLLAEGRVIGWVQGRSEFGPRALGNRCILADARPAQNKQTINAMIKKREAFRPFAPAVTAERLRDYFEVPASVESVPFMILVLPVRQSQRETLGAVTHVDGSARVQSVSREHNALFHSLIEEFGRLTGVPVVLNTSFNNHAEPIVDSVDDAVTAFLTTGIHALIVGDWLVTRPTPQPAEGDLLKLSARLAPSRKLTRRTARDGTLSYSIESTASRFSGARRTPISEALQRLLLRASAGAIADDCAQLGLNEHATSLLARELLEHWTNRAVQLLPARAS